MRRTRGCWVCRREQTPQAGLAFLLFIAGITIAANVVSNIGLRRLGPKVIVPAGLVIAAGATWLTRIGVHGGYTTVVAPALVLLGLGCAVVSAFSLGPAGTQPTDTGVAAALVNSSKNQVGGSLGAALLNSIAASAAASYLAQHAADPSATAATVHGDIVSFTFLVTLFGAGAIITALLFPLRERITIRLTTPADPAPAALQPERGTSVAAD